MVKTGYGGEASIGRSNNVLGPAEEREPQSIRSREARQRNRAQRWGQRPSGEVRAHGGCEAQGAVRRRRDGSGQAPAGGRPFLRALGPQPDHLLRRGGGGGRRHRGWLAGSGG